jgi:hypothetical protein
VGTLSEPDRFIDQPDSVSASDAFFLQIAAVDRIPAIHTVRVFIPAVDARTS